ncbi:MAG: M23 family metallopeptidase [Cyanobacteria bacterium K_DeepCast_35m_m2_023]|nr:M23 family metallopeptidase [Cyanobacteria bacterium K_DeepCast_35m_m2_023]
MPWVCSDRTLARPGWRRRRVVLLAAALAPLLITPTAGDAQATSRWRLGVFPVAGFLAYTSHYGTRIGPGGSVEPHHGLDIAAPLGSPIHSWWGGVVQQVINDGSCGLGLVIRSGAYEHIYCHLGGSLWQGGYRSGPVALQVGQAVRTGQLIGHVGLTGRTTGPHLHWGVRHSGQWLDPARVLRAMAASRRSLGWAPKRLSPPRVRGI